MWNKICVPVNNIITSFGSLIFCSPIVRCSETVLNSCISWRILFIFLSYSIFLANLPSSSFPSLINFLSCLFLPRIASCMTVIGSLNFECYLLIDLTNLQYHPQYFLPLSPPLVFDTSERISFPLILKTVWCFSNSFHLLQCKIHSFSFSTYFNFNRNYQIFSLILQY